MKRAGRPPGGPSPVQNPACKRDLRISSEMTTEATEHSLMLAHILEGKRQSVPGVGNGKLRRGHPPQ